MIKAQVTLPACHFTLSLPRCHYESLSYAFLAALESSKKTFRAHPLPDAGALRG